MCRVCVFHTLMAAYVVWFLEQRVNNSLASLYMLQARARFFFENGDIPLQRTRFQMLKANNLINCYHMYDDTAISYCRGFKED